MRVQFLGMKNQTKSTGCSACSRKRVSNYTFEHSKRMVLPSGKIQQFSVGKTYEVSESEGTFLLEYGYYVNGNLEHPFITV